MLVRREPSYLTNIFKNVFWIWILFLIGRTRHNFYIRVICHAMLTENNFMEFIIFLTFMWVLVIKLQWTSLSCNPLVLLNHFLDLSLLITHSYLYHKIYKSNYIFQVFSQVRYYNCNIWYLETNLNGESCNVHVCSNTYRGKALSKFFIPFSLLFLSP